jgi:hypothetical protein
VSNIPPLCDQKEEGGMKDLLLEQRIQWYFFISTQRTENIGHRWEPEEQSYSICLRHIWISMLWVYFHKLSWPIRIVSEPK